MRRSEIRPGTNPALRGGVIVGTLRIQPAPHRHAEVLEIFQAIQGPVLAQPGCVACHIYEEPGPAGAIVLVERWESQAALEAHLRSEDYRRILGAIELSGGSAGSLLRLRVRHGRDGSHRAGAPFVGNHGRERERHMKVIIVGGVAGGASCAARLRRLDEKAEILMVERGPYVSYANCGLPYHVGGVIAKESSLLVATEQMFRAVFAIDCRTSCEAVAISPKKKTVDLRERRDRRGHHRVLRQARAVARRGADPSAAARHRPAGDLLGADRAGRPDDPRVARPRRRAD